MEFQPGELPSADTAPVSDVYQGADLLDGQKRMSLSAWLALGAAGAILLLIVGSAAVTFASNAIRERSFVDITLLIALVVFVASLLYMLGRQTRALRKLKSAERAREMASQLSKLDSAGSGTRLLAVLKALYSDNVIVLGKLHAASAALQPHHTDRDVIELLNRDVFLPMDRDADERNPACSRSRQSGGFSMPAPGAGRPSRAGHQRGPGSRPYEDLRPPPQCSKPLQGAHPRPFHGFLDSGHEHGRGFRDEGRSRSACGRGRRNSRRSVHRCAQNVRAWRIGESGNSAIATDVVRAPQNGDDKGADPRTFSNCWRMR